MQTGAELIAEKARTNREHKGYTPEHDDAHDRAELAAAARCYLTCAEIQMSIGDTDLAKELDETWPFEPDAWKPSDDPIRNLVHAGALIAAEIDRVQRKRERESNADALLARRHVDQEDQ
jgi:hypothetical protein